MHVVIMGCGRVGSELAHTLLESNHSVAVIDQERRALERLGDDFPGTKVLGVGFDRGRLMDAGIEQAQAFAAVSNGDNSNILAARIARETFNVPSVVARIYDPGRAEIYTRLGIPTVGTVRWTADQILRRIDPTHAKDDWRDPSGRVVVTEVPFPPTWIGTTYLTAERLAGIKVVAVTRYGEGILPDAITVVQEHDIVHIAAPAEEMARIRSIVSAGPEGS